MIHLLACAVLWLCAGLAFASGTPQPGEGAAPSTVQAPARPMAARELPLPNEAQYTARLNAELQAAHEQRERYRVRQRWISAAVVSGLVIGLVALVWWGLRSRQARVVRFSRMALWAPCLLLASAWFFPWSLYAAVAFAPAFPVVWWKRALPWWELGVATVLYLPALVLTWFVFKALAAMGTG